MVFRTKIITGRKNPKATVAIAGAIFLVLAVFLSLAHGHERYAFCSFALSAVFLVGGAILARGDITNIMVSVTDLVVSSSEIRIGEAVYPLARVMELEFLVEGYDGMQGPDWDSPTEGILNGTMNYVYFVFDGRKVKCRFYLPDAVCMQQLVGVFKELNAAQIPFAERSWAKWTA